MQSKPTRHYELVIPLLFLLGFVGLFLLWRATNRRFDALIAFLDIRLQRGR